MTDSDAQFEQTTELPPRTNKFDAGGVDTNSVRCTRCGAPATRGYEGTEFLNFCESCFDDFGDWLGDGR